MLHGGTNFICIMRLHKGVLVIKYKVIIDGGAGSRRVAKLVT